MEKIKYWLEIREFKIGVKKALIPFEKFFRSNEINNSSTSLIDGLDSERETLGNFYIKGVGI
jgi:hypothetical protein